MSYPALRPLSGLLLALTIGSAAFAAEPLARQASDPYYVNGLTTLEKALAQQPNRRKAKNVILFVGDGLGISTIVAARIHEGQSRGVDGVSNSLSFEALPYLALSKTYSHDTMVTDSAASASAMLTGVKTRNGAIGVDGTVVPNDCPSVAGSAVTTLAEMAKAKGRWTGAVTTTRVTHATPASTYAHVANRDWEGDQNMPAKAKAAGCKDIARQLVEAPNATRLNVAMGGGRSRFRPKDQGGNRADGRDLIQTWLATSGPRTAAVMTAAELKSLKLDQVDHLLGLFGQENLPYEADRATQGATVPTLTEMATTAVDILSKNPKGYFLMVEGGRIDMGSHAGNAYRALTETEEFAKAIGAVMAKVDMRDTLIIVTADHSHGLVISGYAARNDPILGLAADEDTGGVAKDKKPYAILSYATGPGGADGENHREDLSSVDTKGPNFTQQATVPLFSAAHSGEDVAIFAGGPQAHLFQGVVEQSYIFQVMRYALGL
ncbi:MAG: hypothetical protein RJA87_676 [Pseudomonadota bacterium]|jgi:alkaline phosphatase